MRVLLALVITVSFVAVPEFGAANQPGSCKLVTASRVNVLAIVLGATASLACARMAASRYAPTVCGAVGTLVGGYGDLRSEDLFSDACQDLLREYIEELEREIVELEEFLSRLDEATKTLEQLSPEQSEPTGQLQGLLATNIAEKREMLAAFEDYYEKVARIRREGL